MVVVPVNVCVPDDIYEDILNGTLESLLLEKSTSTTSGIISPAFLILT